MLVIGLMGGVASGKSFVARELERLGAAVLDADRSAHAALGRPEVVSAAVARWGPAILDPAGAIDRRKLGQIVFAPEAAEERKYLEHLTHPLVRQEAVCELDCRRAAGCPAVVIDAPLLIEAGWDGMCDRLIFVDTPRPQRLARAEARGWTEEEFAAREGAQESLELKRRRADMILDNSGSALQTRAQLERYWHALFG